MLVAKSGNGGSSPGQMNGAADVAKVLPDRVMYAVSAVDSDTAFHLGMSADDAADPRQVVERLSMKLDRLRCYLQVLSDLSLGGGASHRTVEVNSNGLAVMLGDLHDQCEILDTCILALGNQFQRL